MPRKMKNLEAAISPMASRTSDLLDIVTNLNDATKHLSPGERAEIEDAQRSVVEARHCGETAADHIHVL